MATKTEVIEALYAEAMKPTLTTQEREDLLKQAQDLSRPEK